MKRIIISMLLVVGLAGFCEAQLDHIELIMSSSTIGARNGSLWVVYFEPQFSCLFPQHNQPFQRGDVNGDAKIEIFDVMYILLWLGGDVTETLCWDAADAEDDGDIDIYDAMRVFGYLGGTSPPPLPPCCGVPDNCGSDPTPDPLNCYLYLPCDQGAQKMVTIAAVGDVTASWLRVGRVRARRRVVAVPVELANSEPLAGFSFTITYDPERIRATAVDYGDLVAGEFDLLAGGPGEGEIRAIGLSDMEMGDGLDRLPVGERVIAQIVFELTEEVLEGDVPLEISESVFAIDHQQALRHRVVNGAIRATVLAAEKFRLNQNHPNPLNPTTVISYCVPADLEMGEESRSPITLRVYNIAGQLVRTLVNGHQAPGEYRVVWDGKDERGDEVASGIYLYRLRAGAWEITKRMAVIR